MIPAAKEYNMGRKSKKKSGNTNYIPKRASDLYCETDVYGNTNVFINKNEPFNFAAQQLLKKPEVSSIHLEGIGNFIWPLIDGKNSYQDIKAAIKEKFGDDAEPLDERLTKYFKAMAKYGFIIIPESK